MAERGSLALIDSADNAARIDSLMCVDEKARWEAKKKGSISFAGPRGFRGVCRAIPPLSAANVAAPFFVIMASDEFNDDTEVCCIQKLTQ